eukprot:g6517.t1
MQVPSAGYSSSSSINAFFNIARTEGIRGLYAGFATSLAGLIVGPIYITVFEGSRSVLMNRFDATVLSPLISGFAGLTASAVAQTVAVPIDIVSSRRMVAGISHSSHAKSKTPFNIAKKLYNAEGILGFYRGYMASILVSLPTSSTMWGVFFALQPRVQKVVGFALQSIDSGGNRYQQYEKNSGNKSHSEWESLTPALLTSFITGGLAGGVAAFVSAPMDVIRTRLQVVEKAGSTIKTSGIQIFKNDGISGFWRGCGARSAALIPSTALLLTAYELLKRICVKDDYKWT